MTLVFKNYFNLFLHPTERDLGAAHELSYEELLGISWTLHLLYAVYSIGGQYLGIVSYDYLSSSADFTHLLFDSANLSLEKITIFSTIFKVIFYPFIFQFAFKFWLFLIKSYADIFDSRLNDESRETLQGRSDELVKTLFTANIFLIIPVIGFTLSVMAQAFYLYTGLKSKLGFTKTQAFLVLLTPLFILFLFTILIASYFTLLFSMI